MQTRIHEKTNDGWRINMVGCTDAIVQEAGCKEATQKDIAMTYAMAIKSQAQGADTPDWPTINRAILSRWKMSGLERIKKRAVDLLRGLEQIG
jgi:hypothetical protein